MTILQPWPEHRNPDPSRTASAPYNFVPLPEKIIPAVPDAEELPDHDKYYPGLRSGYFDVTLTTRSPLYIRGLVSAKDFPHQESDRDVKNKPEFFHISDEGRPVIPGSSLRGMLRSLLEILSYSKIQWVSKKQLFFRTMDGSAIGTYYNQRMVEELKGVHPERSSASVYRARVEGGFFRIHEDGTYSIEQCTVARVEAADLRKLFGLTYNRELYELDGHAVSEEDAGNPNQTPKWSYQHQEIQADVEQDEHDYLFRKQPRKDGRGWRHRDLYLRYRGASNLGKGKQSGKLVLTGHMDFKHLAFLFVPNEQLGLSVTRIDVPNNPGEQDLNKRLVDRFHDDDQLTQWQKKAFPTDRPPTGQPKPGDGHLQDGDPVFFLREENGKLVFFGRAQMFRLPYKHDPFELVPDELRQVTDIDYAQALFGFVLTVEEIDKLGADAPQQGKKGRAYAGRVTVTNGILKSDPTDLWLAGDFTPTGDFIPKILASPKPTAFQQYLTQHHPQQLPEDKKKLDHYDSNTSPDSYETVIRGHKLYWHQGLDTDTDQRLSREKIYAAIKGPDEVDPDDTQHTRFKPLRPGVKFSFRVYFENLSCRELGALCWTLHPRGELGQRYYHHLGMGKPLGLGAVELHARLHIIDRPMRYKKLFFNDSGDSWQSGEEATVEDLADPNVLERLTQPFEDHLLSELNPDPPCTRLTDMLRIAILLKLLEWPGYRALEGGPPYLRRDGRPNTRYMKIQPDNEYRNRLVLPGPTQFDESYFKDKSRPQAPPEASQADQMQVNQTDQPTSPEQQHGMTEPVPQANTVEQAPAEKNIAQPVLSPELAEQFYIGRELISMVNFTQGEQGVEVRFWQLDPTKVIGFIPKELIGRKLGDKISVVVTGLRQESSGRLVVELKLRPRR